ncbi:MAG: hypothetical protein WB507_02290 [Solirubrobacterales bacterium]
MHFSLRPRLSYSNVIATLALFIALGGAAIAAGLPRHSVGARQLKRGAVTTRALRKGAVSSAKLAQGSVIAGKLGTGAVSPGTIADGAVGGAAIANGAVSSAKLATNAVTAGKIANGAVTTAKLGTEVGPLLGNLNSGQTLRGVFSLGKEAKDPADFVNEGISFFFPLASAPAESAVLKSGESSTSCPGLGGANHQNPGAGAGNLCVYIAAQSGAVGPLEIEGKPSRLGFDLKANASAEGAYAISGFWAVTAP